MEARKLSDELKTKSTDADPNLLQSLDAMGYDEAAQYVYGMHYDQWKKRYAKKASDETMQKFNDSKPLWAKHDKAALAKRAEAPAGEPRERVGAGETTTTTTSSTSASTSLLSNVCCQDVDAPPAPKAPAPARKSKSSARVLPTYEGPAPPKISFSLAVLTVSDRAASGDYTTGDLSGPAVQEAVQSAVASYGGSVQVSSVETAIVPDETTEIQGKLKEWSDDAKVNLILTTGGTGFSSRDITPEATNAVVDKVCEGIVTFCTMQCARIQPLSSLSRGSAGIRGKTLIVNLPGNPKGVGEIIPILLPLALHAIEDLA